MSDIPVTKGNTNALFAALKAVPPAAPIRRWALPPAAAPVALPPLLPPAPPGMAAYSTLWRMLTLAAFGDGKLYEFQAARRRVERLENALERHETAKDVPTNLVSLLTAPQSKGMGGLFGLGAWAIEAEKPEIMLARAKLARVREHLTRLKFKEMEILEQLVEQQHRACDFIRRLGMQDALCAYVVDADKNERPVKADAWRNAENWERLTRERVFRAGVDAFDPPGVPCFLLPIVEKLEAFVAERGESALGDIHGAMQALGASAGHEQKDRPHKKTKPEEVAEIALKLSIDPNTNERDRFKEVEDYYRDVLKKLPPGRTSIQNGLRIAGRLNSRTPKKGDA